MSNNFSAGWNDPPMLGYTPSQGATKNAVVRDMFSRRVAFPVSSNHVTTTSPPFNQQLVQQPLSHHSTIAPNGLIGHHHNFSQAYIHETDNINRSVSSPCFSQENQPLPGAVVGDGQLPVHQSHVTVNWSLADNKSTSSSHNDHNGHQPPSQKEDIVVAQKQDSVVAYAYTNEDIMGNLTSTLASCTETIQPLAANNVEKRLTVLKSALDSNSLSVTCRERLCILIGHLANHRYKEAYDIHSVMMIEHFSEVNPWMVGVKAVIMECLKKK